MLLLECICIRRSTQLTSVITMCGQLTSFVSCFKAQLGANRQAERERERENSTKSSENEEEWEERHSFTHHYRKLLSPSPQLCLPNSKCLSASNMPLICPAVVFFFFIGRQIDKHSVPGSANFFHSLPFCAPKQTDKLAGRQLTGCLAHHHQ